MVNRKKTQKQQMIIFFALLFTVVVKGQDNSKTPVWGVKNNLLYDATTTINLGVEIATGSKNTLEVSGGYNPFMFSDVKKFKHLLMETV